MDNISLRFKGSRSLGTRIDEYKRRDFSHIVKLSAHETVSQYKETDLLEDGERRSGEKDLDLPARSPASRSLAEGRRFGVQARALVGLHPLHNQGHSDSSQGEVTLDVLDGISPFKYSCKKRGRGDETLIGFTF